MKKVFYTPDLASSRVSYTTRENAHQKSLGRRARVGESSDGRRRARESSLSES